MKTIEPKQLKTLLDKIVAGGRTAPLPVEEAVDPAFSQALADILFTKARIAADLPDLEFFLKNDKAISYAIARGFGEGAVEQALRQLEEQISAQKLSGFDLGLLSVVSSQTLHVDELKAISTKLQICAPLTNMLTHFGQFESPELEVRLFLMAKSLN